MIINMSKLPSLTNDVYYPLYADSSRYLVLKGGGSSGKSVFSAEKLILRSFKDKKRPHRFLVVRKVKADLRDSCFAELKNVIRSWGMEGLFLIPQGRSSDLYLKNQLTGAEFLFYGLDDVEKRKSIQGITGIWIEEASEIDADDFRQLDIRMRGKTEFYKQMILTFNPVSITHWLKDEFFDRKKEGARVVETTYHDNRFLDRESINVLEGFRETDEYYYTVYCLGQWGVLGKTVFNAQTVTERLLQVKKEKPLRVGNFIYDYVNERIVDSSIRFIDDENGFVRIYEEPQEGFPYVLGGDIAEGGADFSAGSVRNNVTWDQAATWHGHVDTDIYAKQMYCLGKYFNYALVGIETNFDTHPVKELQRLGYSRQYVREKLDKYTGQVEKKFGFQTTKITRPIIVSKCVAMARDHIDTWNDYTTLDEMLTFVRDENGKPAAQEGKHDDTILADAIALEARNQQSMKAVEKKEEKVSVIKQHKDRLARENVGQFRKRVTLS